MAKVSAIRAGKKGRKRVSLFLDGRFSLSLEAEVVVRENLRIGQELSAEQIAVLSRADRCRRCLDAAANYLSYRPHSEAELRQRLVKRGFEDSSVEAALRLLEERGLVDDIGFARFWRDSRQSLKPCSRWLTRLELRKKGVAEDIIDQVVDTVDDDDSAYRAAMAKLRSLPQTDYQGFRRRLGEYLKRRGFSYGVINQTVRRIWQEQGEPGQI